jgi:hypothetical protein
MHFLKLLRDECRNQPRMLVVDPEWALPRKVTSRILWALPYWRDLAQGGKADQFKAGWNVRRGNYHIKMRYERCLRAFSCFCSLDCSAMLFNLVTPIPRILFCIFSYTLPYLKSFVPQQSVPPYQILIL